MSEPLSDYQRWAHSLAAPMVDAGEDIRWVPRARVSELMFPGNDFWLFDDQLLAFMVFAGNGLVLDRAVSFWVHYGSKWSPLKPAAVFDPRTVGVNGP